MNKAFFLLNLLLLTLFACKQDPKNASSNGAPAHIIPGEHANPNVLAGHWVALGFCSRASQYGSVIQAMNNSHLPFAYALTFNPAKPDSVQLYNAVKTWMLPIQYKVDTLQIMGTPNGKPVYLVYQSNIDKEITMFDATGERVKMDRFVKSKADAPEGYTAFATALNHNILSGTFTPVGKGGGKPVRFTAPGFIEGMKDFDRYLICSGGDCMIAGQEIDIITLYNAKYEPKRFGFRYNGQNDTLTLYNMVSPKSTENGAAYTVGTPAFKFARTIPK